MAEVSDPKGGGFELTINVADLDASVHFYTALGFKKVAGLQSPGVVVLEYREFRIGLYRGHRPESLLTFRGGNIARIATRAKAQGLSFEAEPTVDRDGTTTALLRDPDGNVVNFASDP